MLSDCNENNITFQVIFSVLYLTFDNYIVVICVELI